MWWIRWPATSDSPSYKRRVRLSEAVWHIDEGDLLLFRGGGLVGRMIGRVGRGRHSHAAVAAWWHGVPMCLEVREWHGGRAVTLASQVRRFPGAIDVYAANTDRFPDLDRRNAVVEMIALAGCDYGWVNVIKAAMLHMPFIRLIHKADVNDETVSDRPPFCSAAVARSYRLGGKIDPVPGMADRYVEPADLARSAIYKYYCTLTP